MDGELRFRIQGNAPEAFQVVFARVGDQLSATCTCNAGRLGKFCKHRLGLLKGEASGIVSGNAEQVSHIQGLFRGTPAEALLKGLLEAEAVLADAEADFTSRKNSFLRAVRILPADPAS